MADKTGCSSTNLIQELTERGHEFSFFQVMRLMRLFGYLSEREFDSASPEMQTLRIRSNNSLAFPASDIEKINRTEGDVSGFTVTANFLGLYGPASPLPTFYTEDILDEEAADESVTRDFLDIFNHRLFALFFHCGMKYRLFFQVAEEKNQLALKRLYCLLGLGEEDLRKDLPQAYSLIRYAGLLTQFPRSAWGLETMLNDAFSPININVIPCVHRKISIAPEQLPLLGHTGSMLGMDSLLGEEMDDRMWKFRLQIGPVDIDKYHDFLPGNNEHRRLARLTGFFLNDPFDSDMELILAEGEVSPACVGDDRMSYLGCDTWLYAGNEWGEVREVFELQR
jgi:type VI secretion system protein ImpH